MKESPTERLPEILPPSEGERKDGGGFSLHVKDFHYKANDLTELRKIAEQDPALAKQIVETRDGMHRRENNSALVGMVLASVVAISLIGGSVTALVLLGWWQAIVFASGLMFAGHFLRVLMTGQWSETSWIGKLFKVTSPPDQ